jgi:carbonic anhydrase
VPEDIEIAYRYIRGLAGRARAFPADAAEARARLEAGNAAFAELLETLAQRVSRGRRIEIALDARDVGIDAPEFAGVPEQRPFVAVLGCSDARVPTELLFGEGPNDMFVVRVAGNVLGQDVLGSLRYASQHLPLRCMMVLGHSGCGAVTAAVDLFLTPSRMLELATEHAQRGLLAPMVLMVQAAARLLAGAHGPEVERRPGWRAALIETTVALSAAAAAHSIEQDLERREGPAVPVLHGVYVIGSRLVCAADGEVGERVGLAPAPRDQAGFVRDFGAFVRAKRIVGLLG